MTSAKQPSNYFRSWDLPSLFALMMAMALGSFVRLFFALSSDFPLNDGGLFSTMVQDLLNSHYALPIYTSYKSANIPFAYPPLPFYVAAFLSDIMRWPVLDVVRLLPPVVSTLTIPAFYLLSRAILRSKAQSAFAVFAFALLPRSFEWLIMGGGLTRAPGFLFALLTLHQASLLYTRGQKRFVFSTALLAALTILSHPEMAWFAAYSIGILFLFYGRNRRGVCNSLVVAGVALALTAPWLATIAGRYGLSLLSTASRTGWAVWSSWELLIFNFTEEPFLGLLAVVGLLGLFVCVADKKPLLPIWLVLIFIMDPRSAATYAMVPLAMLIGIGIDKVVLPAVRKPSPVNPFQVYSGQSEREESEVWLAQKFEGKLPKAVLGCFLVYAIVSAWIIALHVGLLYVLPREEREAMRWVTANTAEKSKFLLITSGLSMIDQTSEWFPALAERVSLATVQGYEWFPNFEERWERYEELQECATEEASCLEDWAKRASITFTHVYIPKPRAQELAAKPKDCCPALRNSLLDSPDYILIYDNLGATIFMRH